MDLYFYYIKPDYIDYLKRIEYDKRGFNCVPNMNYWNTNKFTFGAILEGTAIIIKKDDVEKVKLALSSKTQNRTKGGRK